MRNRVALFVIALFLALVPAKLSQGDVAFTFTSIDVPGATATLAAGINNAGQIVGAYIAADGTTHGFLDSGGTFTTIDDPNATSGSEITGINNVGQIVGSYNLNTPEDGHLFEGAHGFVSDFSSFTDINFPGASNTTPHKINDSGEIVGVYRIANAEAHGFTDNGGVLAAFNFPATFSTQANGINNQGEIVGRYRLTIGAAKQGFLDNAGSFSTVDFPGASQTVASDIDSFGDIAGFYKSTLGTFGFLDRGGNFSTIKFPNSVGTEAFQINDRDNIVGAYQDQAGVIHGFEATFPAAAQVFVDIRPQSCPNPINIGAQGVLPVAILGTATFDVTTVDPSSVKLHGVSPLRSSVQDTTAPFTGGLTSATSCTTAGPDGFKDLVLQFSNPAVSTALGGVSNGQVLVLTLTGNLLPQFGGAPIMGQDIVVVVKQ